MNPDDNGWPELKRMVIYRIEALEKRVNAMDKKLWGILTGVVLVLVKALFDLAKP